MNEKMINKIVDVLFQNGTGAEARRLVLEMKDGKDGGGWSKSAMKSFIKDFIKDEPASKPSRVTTYRLRPHA